MRVAVVDSAVKQRTRIIEVLRALQYHCSAFNDLGKFSSDTASHFDLLVYHWRPTPLFNRSVKALRRQRPELPILLVTSHSADTELADWLSDSGTDYLVKPVRARELALRAGLLLRRGHPVNAPAPPLRFGRYTFDPARAHAWQDEQPIALTRKEWALALLLFQHLGRPLSRATIHEALWPKSTELNSRSLDTHIARIRKKFALIPAQGYRLVPVYGYGYQLESVAFPGQNPDPQQV